MNRRAIEQLSPDLVNRIAAGEVIERPASLVKELVENALDAGASRITVEIEDGGRTLVRVTDDGAGIPADELALAFAPHATSKLRDDAELSAITTMGFRGEALASIGSVSRAAILSRCGDAGAYEIRNEGGRIGKVIAAAGNAGTSVEVRDLFFNTPARRKFLKSAAAESGQITDMLVRLALPRPAVHFRYLRDGKTVADWPPTLMPDAHEQSDGPTAPDAWHGAIERLLIAWPAEYAEAFRSRPMRIAITDERDASRWQLRGIIGLPEFAATAARYQHVYVNGRAVKDRGASHAMREAYRGLTEPGRHPAGILMLELPPDEVDVNVHPTKAEVRFRNAGRVWSLVHSAVRQVLLANDLAPVARPQVQPPAWSAPREDIRETLASFFKDALGQAQHELDLGTGMTLLSEYAGAEALGLDAESRGVIVAHSLGEAGVLEERISQHTTTRGLSAVDGNQARTMRGLPDPVSAMTRPTMQDDAGPLPPTRENLEGAPVRAIQLHNSYLIVQSDEGMEIIDQHALHERILYEELLARVRRGALESQRLLVPITFDAPEAQVALLEELFPTLARLGIEAEAFGPAVIAVHAFPSFLSRLDPAAFLGDLLSRAETDLPSTAGEEGLLHEVLDMMACRAAVKAGEPLTGAEISALIERRELVQRRSNCPHGRPTTLRLSLQDLERQFKRSGF